MIEILDSTLFEGGHINNWTFGKQHIRSIISQLDKANIDFVDVGAYQDHECGDDCSFIDTIEKIDYLINEDKRRNKVLTLRVDWVSSLKDILEYNNLDFFIIRVQFG